MTSHEPSSPAVFWPRCSAVRGCSGRAAGRSGGCPAHLRPREFEEFAGSLRPGGDLDLRGVTVPAWLLDAVLDAVTGPDGRPHLGRARFDGAVLLSDAVLRGVCVEGDSSFNGACFLGGISFYDARFFGNASFRGARFGRNVSFHEARFHRFASFEEAVFTGDALFGEVRWHADASFRNAVLMGAACFDRARFGRDAAMQAACFRGPVSFKRVQVARHARFERTRFRQGVALGPLVAGGRIGLSDATVHGRLRVHAAAPRVTARGVVVRGEAAFRLRNAEVDLEDAVFEGPASVRSLARPIQGLAPPAGPAAVRVVSLRRVDAAGLQLTDVDLSGCGFLGLRRPDALAITGDCPFATVPGRRTLRPWVRGGRAVLAEDLVRGTGGPAHDDRLRALYLELARATADSGRGRLARDFRYGALELRRHGERDPLRRLGLTLLWVTCGYGLRAGRVVAWLAVIVALVCLGASTLHHGDRADTAHIAHPSGGGT
ncbi:pentapeptide repeat-containing protein [Actinomadura bangladeshensis]|uniref:pentapeptide repeat-containing protein n=1 Tax=Actinomadura bangladeshensis TaxID=453573 RepID=UPI001404699D|nr:pentapeptide repeat-containing protein [Actinomadura bangladeshensis]